MQRNVAGGVVVAVLALGVASCGGDSSLTRAEFTRQANAICLKNTKGIAAAGGSQAAFLRAFSTAMGRVADDIAALKPPTELQNRYTAYKRAVAALSDYTGTHSTIEAGSPYITLQTKVSTLADQMHLRYCD